MERNGFNSEGLHLLRRGPKRDGRRRRRGRARGRFVLTEESPAQPNTQDEEDDGNRPDTGCSPLMLARPGASIDRLPAVRGLRRALFQITHSKVLMGQGAAAGAYPLQAAPRSRLERAASEGKAAGKCTMKLEPTPNPLWTSILPSW